MMIPIYAELHNTDVKPFPDALPTEVDGTLCWGVYVISLGDLFDILSDVGGAFELTRHGAFNGKICIVLPYVVDKVEDDDDNDPDLLSFDDLIELEIQLENRNVPDNLRLDITYSIAIRLMSEVKLLRTKYARLINRVDMLEEEMWPFEWVVAGEEHKRRLAAEARVKELEAALKAHEH